MANAGDVVISLSLNDAQFSAALDKTNARLLQFQRAASRAGEVSVTKFQATSSALRLMEGGINNSLRAAERFAGTLPMVGRLMEAAFPVTGAIAFAAILYRMSERFVAFRQQMDGITQAIGRDWSGVVDQINARADSLAVTNDQLQRQLDKLLGHPSSNGLADALDEARKSADALSASLAKDVQQINDIVTKSDVGMFASVLKNQARTAPTDKFIAGAGAQISAVQGEYDPVIAAALASGNKEDVAQARQAEMVKLQSVFGAITATLNKRLEAARRAQQAFTGDYAPGTGIVYPHYQQGSDQSANIAKLQEFAAWLAAEQRDIGGQYGGSLLRQQIGPLENQRAAPVAAAPELRTRGVSRVEQMRQRDMRPILEQQQRDLRYTLDQQAAQTRDDASLAAKVAEAQQRIQRLVEQGHLSDVTDRLITGRITQYQAAVADAKIHQQAFAEQLAALDKRLQQARDLGSLPGSQATITELQGQRQQLVLQAKQQAGEDQAKIQERAMDTALGRMVEDWGKMAENIERVAVRAFDGFNKSLVDAMTGAKHSGREFGQVFENAGKGIMNSVLEKAETPLLKKLGIGKADGSEAAPFWVKMKGDAGKTAKDAGSVLQGLFGKHGQSQQGDDSDSDSGGGSAISSDTLKQMGSWTEKAGKSIWDGLGKLFQGAHAAGGSVVPGMAALVGEQGPELFVPRSAGTIVPNGQFGGSQHVYHIDARGANDPAAVHAAVARALPHAVAASMQAQHDHARRTPHKR